MKIIKKLSWLFWPILFFIALWLIPAGHAEDCKTLPGGDNICIKSDG